jgi:hypothetical protein
MKEHCIGTRMRTPMLTTRSLWVPSGVEQRSVLLAPYV